LPNAAANAAPGRGSGRYLYERRRPELGTLHRVVRENLQTLYAAVEEGFATAPLPGFVRREFEHYLDCGLLCRGFAVLECEGCQERRLVAFSCKGRAWCPACLGRRMAQTAANLIDHVLPTAPLRQFVITFPFELRARLAYDGKLFAAVTRISVDSILGFYRRRMRERDGVVGQSGAVTVVQRVSADLRLNPHLHAILLDGVFAPAEGALLFHPLPSLDTDEVADLLQVIRVRVLDLLERRGVIEDRHQLTLLDDGFADREPALAQLAAAAVSGLAPAGPEQRQRPPIALRGQLGVQVTAPRCVAELGFSLHAATTASAEDVRGREALVRYALRPPLAQERLHIVSDELVRIELRRPFRDGTVAVDLDPLSLLCRLAAAVPPPRSHTVRYAGVLGAASKWRALVVPAPPPGTEDQAAETGPSSSRPPTHRSGYRPWAELLKRTFALEVEICPRCGGRMKLRALVTKPSSIQRFLRHLGEPTDAPPLQAARDPPYFKSRAVRRALGELDPPPSAGRTQGELFGG
jgi:hypothetical protein